MSSWQISYPVHMATRLHPFSLQTFPLRMYSLAFLFSPLAMLVS